jgi:N-acetyl-gamma-glutamyl-phosphate reductase common form
MSAEAISTVAAVPAVPTIVLGGSGYVAGELLRLLAGHPNLRPAAVVSTSQAGEPVAAAFPHLAGCYPGLVFAAPEALPALLAEPPTAHARFAVFSAAPHGTSAHLVDGLLTEAERAGAELRLVDLSADFRFATAAAYEEVYGHPHGAPHRMAEFRCDLPEHLTETPAAHIAHPGCFTTAATLATVPLLRLGMVEPEISVVAITGSTGAGRTPTGATHHPARRSNLYAYNPLRHRHQPEMRHFASAALGEGGAATVHFIPHAGPFARGIHATVLMKLRAPASAAEVTDALARFYEDAPLVDVLPEPPRLQDVVGTNRCRLSAAVDGEQLVVCSAIDNLVKGAAGGAVQWMNRLLGLAETAGLTLPGLGWL